MPAEQSEQMSYTDLRHAYSELHQVCEDYRIKIERLEAAVTEAAHRLEHWDFNDPDLPIQLAAALRSTGDSDD